MKRRVVEWTIEEVYKKRGQMSFPDFQREPHLWTLKDKQLLIDSILNDIDIPKLYLHETEKGFYEVIDGQQRLWAIWEFIDNRYKFARHGKTKTFEGLDLNDQNKIRRYALQITLIDDVSDEYLRKLFLRLQFGLLLVSGEKLHALVGSMRNFIFNKMVKHPFIKSIKISERRFAKQTLCAQICINSFSREENNTFSRTRYDDLEYFFEDYKKVEGSKLTFFENRCDHIMNVLDNLNGYFKEKAVELRNRSFIVSVYLFAEELIKKHQKREIDNIMPQFVEFSLQLLKRLKAEAKAGFVRKNKVLYVLGDCLSNAPGEKYQIERRHEKLVEFFEYFKKQGKIMGDR